MLHLHGPHGQTPLGGGPIKAADFYVGARELFGVLIPGILWEADVFLLLGIAGTPTDAPLIQLRAVLSPFTPMLAAVILLGALTMGWVTDHMAMRVALRLAEHLFRIPEAMLHNVRKLESLCRRQLVRCYGPLPITKVLIDRNADLKWETEYDAPLFEVCKELAAKASVRSSRDLDFREARINFEAMLPLPLLVFVLLWAMKCVLSRGLWLHLICGCALASAVTLGCLWQARYQRVSEAIRCYKLFLITQVRRKKAHTKGAFGNDGWPVVEGTTRCLTGRR